MIDPKLTLSIFFGIGMVELLKVWLMDIVMRRARDHEHQLFEKAIQDGEVQKSLDTIKDMFNNKDTKLKKETNETSSN